MKHFSLFYLPPNAYISQEPNFDQSLGLNGIVLLVRLNALELLALECNSNAGWDVHAEI